MYSVLVVDDEPKTRRGIVKLLHEKEEVWEVVGESKDGLQALKMAEDTNPNLVITDIRMPKMDGLEFIEQLKIISPSTFIIILTGYGQFEYAQKAIKYKVFEFLLKPLDKSEFFKTMDGIAEQIKIIERQKIKLGKADLVGRTRASLNIYGTKNNNKVRYPIEIEKKLTNCIAVADIDSVEEQIGQFIGYIIDHNAGIFDEEYMIYRFVGAIVDVASFAGVSEAVYKENIKKLTNIVGCHDDFEVVHNELSELASKIIAEIEEMNNQKLDRTIGYVLELIDKNYTRDISLEEVAEKVNLTPSYLSSYFKKEMGISFIDYITQMRMERAKELLITTHLRIYDIAENLSYNDAKYFTRTFKKNVGVTPSQYREYSKNLYF